MTERQEVNLYVAHLRPQVDWFSPKNLGVGTGVWLLLMVLLAVHGAYQSSTLEQQVNISTQSLQQLTSEVQVLKGRLPKSRAAELDREMTRLASEIERRQAISRLISGQNLGNQEGFSSSMQGLARHSNESLYLQSFALRQGGGLVSLQGEVREAHFLPAYLKALQGDKSFHESHFGPLSIVREDQRLRFSMNESLQEAEQP